MRLTKAAIEAIRAKGLYPQLAIALGKSVSAVYRYVNTNDDSLTKASALEVIRKETGLGDEEILEKEVAEATR